MPISAEGFIYSFSFASDSKADIFPYNQAITDFLINPPFSPPKLWVYAEMINRCMFKLGRIVNSMA
jgi:hypothetical protein